MHTYGAASNPHALPTHPGELAEVYDLVLNSNSVWGCSVPRISDRVEFRLNPRGYKMLAKDESSDEDDKDKKPLAALEPHDGIAHLFWAQWEAKFPFKLMATRVDDKGFPAFDIDEAMEVNEDMEESNYDLENIRSSEHRICLSF
jgi:hypothetical protein